MASVQEMLERIWNDESLKQRLLSHPDAALKELGVDVPPGVSVQVHENTGKLFHAVLPAKPEGKVSLGNDTLAKIVERAWSDEAYKQQLLSDPKGAVAEMGVNLPPGTEIKVWENTPTVQHMVLPAKPAENELSEMELETVAGGTSKGSNQVPANEQIPPSLAPLFARMSGAAWGAAVAYIPVSIMG